MTYKRIFKKLLLFLIIWTSNNKAFAASNQQREAQSAPIERTVTTAELLLEIQNNVIASYKEEGHLNTNITNFNQHFTTAITRIDKLLNDSKSDAKFLELRERRKEIRTYFIGIIKSKMTISIENCIKNLLGEICKNTDNHDISAHFSTDQINTIITNVVSSLMETFEAEIIK